NAMKVSIALSRQKRDAIRQQSLSAEEERKLIQESQHEKASLHRLKKQWQERIDSLKNYEKELCGQIATLRAKRRAMSDELQKWIFRQYIVHDVLGNQSDIWDIFASKGLIPPGGTGDCAAPKLLEYAFRNHLTPLAMGEFWYGLSPLTAVRVHGHFYPSCTSKCGPLLGYMLHGLSNCCASDIVSDCTSDTVSDCTSDIVSDCTSGCISNQISDITPECKVYGQPVIIHIDEAIIVVSKPSRMPSVPGLDGRLSLQEWLDSKTEGPVLSVHRLDMDTSGLMIFARTPAAQAILSTQFENRTVKKTYIARLCPSDLTINLKEYPSNHDETIKCSDNRSGEISIRLSPDYDERPRQKADMKNGKEAITLYRIIQNNPDGSTDIEFHPQTGRTHQLRVHSAHPLGLGRPIIGDLLYGSCTVPPTKFHLSPNTSPTASATDHRSSAPSPTESATDHQSSAPSPTESVTDHRSSAPSPAMQQTSANNSTNQYPATQVKSERYSSDQKIATKFVNSNQASRLHLHALTITIIHPQTNQPQTYTSHHNSYETL
ncbi:MAG: pseudouridine synthase, partial [Candidatus Cryptobacteroides sp.]